MYLIATRSFPPEVGGMQSLMWGLAKEMSKNFMIKVFADYQENHKEFDKEVNFSIERVGGIKFLRKIRKAQLINEYLKENKVQGIIADHWKSLELINTDKKKYCLIHGKEINHPKGSSLNKRANKVLNNVETNNLNIKEINTLGDKRINFRIKNNLAIYSTKNSKNNPQITIKVAVRVRPLNSKEKYISNFDPRTVLWSYQTP